METPCSASYNSSSNKLVQHSKSTEWTREENKQFESALAMYDQNTPDRWVKVAAMIPGKTVLDVIKQYLELEEDVSDIEVGMVPLEVVENCNFDAFQKKSTSPQERKRGPVDRR